MGFFEDAVLFPPPAVCAPPFTPPGAPLKKRLLAEILDISGKELLTAAEGLTEQLSSRGLVLVETEDALELRTGSEAAKLVKKLRESELSRDLGKAGLEALAIILYQGGATRSEIDWIRGVNSSQTVRSLLLRGLIDRTEDSSDKRKFRYCATTDALAHLGVGSAKDLPRYAELSRASTAAIKEGTDAEHGT